MKQIILKSIDISNFKGVHDLQVSFAEGVTNIYGNNATGKTTVFDAFIWLLFDKDSRNTKNFNIKPLAVNGTTAQRGVEPTVKAIIEVDGREVELKKSYKEKWITQRGKSEAVYDGNETKYSIDKVPMKKNEYVKYIDDLIPEDIFRLLTDVTFFNTQFPWEKRRELLLKMCGDVTDADVIYQNKELRPLTTELTNRTMDQLKKMLMAQRREINDRREQLPIRIDEAHKSIVEGIDIAAAEKAVQKLSSQLETLEADKAALHVADVTESKKNEFRTALDKLEMKNQQYIADQRARHTEKTAEDVKQRNSLETELHRMQMDQERLKREIGSDEKTLTNLRQQYEEIFDSQWTGDAVCPTCGQSLPEAEVAESKAKFQLERSRKLEENQKSGKSRKDHMEILNEQLGEIMEKMSDLAIKLEALPAVNEFLPEDIPEYREEKADIERQLVLLSNKDNMTVVQEQMQKINDRKIEVERELDIQKFQLLQVEHNKKSEARIQEMAAEEKQLAAEIEAIDKQIFLTELFTRTKVNMLEEKINKTFKYARFKLFTEQINSGLKECCEVTFEGVPYADLNSAMRINVGIDIINALSEYYDVSAPVIVDNAESVTDLLPANGQMIRLVVSEGDAKLRVEAVA